MFPRIRHSNPWQSRWERGHLPRALLLPAPLWVVVTSVGRVSEMGAGIIDQVLKFKGHDNNTVNLSQEDLSYNLKMRKVARTTRVTESEHIWIESNRSFDNVLCRSGLYRHQERPQQGQGWDMEEREEKYGPWGYEFASLISFLPKRWASNGTLRFGEIWIFP